MRCSGILVGLILAGLLVPTVVQAQEAKDVDPVADAVQTLKDSANPELGTEKQFKMQLQQARSVLVKHPEQGVPAMVALLQQENIAQIRLNAAIVLAEYAGQGGEISQALLDGLKQCVGDSNDAVKYYGVMGLLDAKAPVEMRSDVVKVCLDSKRPRVLRILTAEAVSTRNFKGAAPLMVAYLQSLLPDYERALDNRLTVEKGAARGEGVGDVRIPAMDVSPRAIRRATPPPGTPPVRAGREPDEAAREVVVEYERIDPSEWSYAEVQQWIPEIQKLPEYEELHWAGLCLEDMVSDNPTESKFEFKTTPPWDLKTCVEKAVEWMKAQGGA